VNDVQFTWNGCEWNTIPSFPKYAASKCGKIARIVAHKCNQDVPYLKSQKFMSGSWTVRIADKTLSVHRLVCETWNGPSVGDRVYCCHLDGDRNNNNASNLIWATFAMKNAIVNGNDPRVKLDFEKARHIRAVFAEQGESCIEMLAESLGVSKYTVIGVIEGKSWKETNA